MMANNDLLNAPREFPNLAVQGNVLLAMHELQELHQEDVIQAVIHLAYNCYMQGVQDNIKATAKAVMARVEKDKEGQEAKPEPVPAPASAPVPPYVMDYGYAVDGK